MRTRSLGRRRRATVRKSAVPFPVEPCVSCGVDYRWFGTLRLCDACQCKQLGCTPKGSMPDGTPPRMFCQSTGAMQSCTGCGIATDWHALTSAGRCAFCALPGADVGTSCKVHDGRMHVRIGASSSWFDVELNADGTVPVLVVQQNGAREVVRDVHPLLRPEWGSGWLVCRQPRSDADHLEWVEWRTNWDSSD